MRNYSDRKPNYINMTSGRIETRVQEQGQFIMYKSSLYSYKVLKIVAGPHNSYSWPYIISVLNHSLLKSKHYSCSNFSFEKSVFHIIHEIRAIDIVIFFSSLHIQEIMIKKCAVGENSNFKTIYISKNLTEFLKYFCF